MYISVHFITHFAKMDQIEKSKIQSSGITSEIVSESKSNNLKRKLESDSDDELDNKIKKKESYEQNKLKVDLKPENKNLELDEKFNNKENANSPKTTTSNTPMQNKSTLTASLSGKLLVQQKLTFSPSLKSSTSDNSSMSFQCTPIKRNNSEWLIEDYLVDDQWRKWLADEFDKQYFKEINLVLKPGYQKNILRPPKELVFNALNSTKLDKIKVVIIGQDPYHDDGQVTKFEV